MIYGDFHVIAKEVQEHLGGLLEEKGHVSKDVASILVEEFLKAKRHLSAEEFCATLQEKGIALDKEKVSQVLELFTEIGFASSYQFEGENAKRYEPFQPRTHHDHFVCVKCKKVIEFSNDQLEKMQDSLIFQKGCRPLFHKLEVYGLCEECQPQSQKPVAITHIPEGRIVKLYKVEGGEHLRKRLMGLGFLPNTPLRIIKNSYFGPLVVELKDSRLAIGWGEAQQILVLE